MRSWGSFVAAGLLWAPAAAWAADSAPVIAVFPIEDSSGNLSPKALVQIGDYLAVKLTETGKFQVVPRKDIEAQLKEKKAASYKACYDQACQIEIGREVAAQKILQCQIVEVGGQCAVTATVFDLRVAATEKAASHKGACTEPAIVASLEAVVAGLAQGMGPAAPPPPAAIASSPPPPSSKAPTIEPGFTLRVEASPDDAEILVDGTVAGRGSAAVNVPKGSSHSVVIERDGYTQEKREVKLDRDERISVELAMTPERQAARTEWIGAGVTAGVTFGGGFMFGAVVRGPTLRFGNLAWSLAEVDVAFGLGNKTTVGVPGEFSCDDEAVASNTLPVVCKDDMQILGLFGAVTRPAFHLTLDESNSLELGLGVGVQVQVGVEDDQQINDRYVGPALAPAIRYWRRSDSALGLGAALKAYVPLIGRCHEKDQSLDSFVACRSGSPVLVQLEVPIGYVY